MSPPSAVGTRGGHLLLRAWQQHRPARPRSLPASDVVAPPRVANPGTAGPWCPGPGLAAHLAGLRFMRVWETWADEQRVVPQPHTGTVLWASGLGPAAATGRAAHRVPAPQQVPRTARGPEPCVCCFLSTASRVEARSHCTCRQLSRQSFLFIRGLCPLHPKEGLCGLSFVCPLPASPLLLFGAVTKDKPGDSNA